MMVEMMLELRQVQEDGGRRGFAASRLVLNIKLTPCKFIFEFLTLE